MAHKLTVEKRSQRQLNPLLIRRQLSRLVQRALAGKRRRQGWEFVGRLRAPSPVRDGEGWLYRTTLAFERSGRKVNASVVQRQFDYIAGIVETAGNARGWMIPAKTKPATEEAIRSGLKDVLINHAGPYENQRGKQASENESRK